MIKKLALILIVFSSLAFAKGGDQSHGGDGWLDDNGKPWLYDLKEGNIHLNPYFSKDSSVDLFMAQKITLALPFIDLNTAKLFTKKLDELNTLNPDLATAVKIAVEKYQWYASDTLLDIKDEGPVLNIPSERQVQLAARIGTEIFIDHKWWKLLTPENKVALLFHEVLYAWIDPEYFFEDGIRYEQQSSKKVRSLVRVLFSSKISRMTPEELKFLLLDLNFPKLDQLGEFSKRSVLNFLEVEVLTAVTSRTVPIKYHRNSFLLDQDKISNSSLATNGARLCEKIWAIRDDGKKMNSVFLKEYELNAGVVFLKYKTKTGKNAYYLKYNSYRNLIFTFQGTHFEGQDKAFCQQELLKNLAQYNQ